MALPKILESASDKDALLTNTAFASWQQELTIARSLWETQYHKEPGGLLRDKPLATAEQWLHQYPHEIEELNCQFIWASLNAAQVEKSQRQSHWEEYVQLACSHASQRFSAGEELAALHDIVQLAQRSNDQKDPPTPVARMCIIATLQRILANIREFCHLKHNHDLTHVALSSEGKVIAAIGKDPVIRLWSVPDGTAIATLTDSQKPINALAFSPNSRRLAYVGEDSLLRLWNLDEGHEENTYAVDRPDLDHLTFSADGKSLAIWTSRDSIVHLWHDQAKTLTRLYNNTAIQRLCFSPSNQLLATSTYDHRIKLWNPKSGQELTTVARKANHTMAFSPCGHLLAVANADHSITLWQVGLSLLAFDPVELVTLRGHSEYITELVFSDDGELLASRSRDYTLRLWTLPAGQLQATSFGLDNVYGSMQFSPDRQKLFVTGHRTPLKYSNLNSLDNKNPSYLFFNSKHQLPSTKNYWHLHFDNDSELQYLVSHSKRHVELWSPQAKTPLTLGETQDKPISIAISPNEQFIALGDRNKTIHIWNQEGSKLFTLDGHSCDVQHVCFGSNTALASAGLDNIIKVWNLESCTELFAITGHSKKINRIAFNDNGDILASASDDGTVKLWHIDFSMLASQGVELASLSVSKQGVSCLSFAGKMLVTGDYTGQLQFWESDNLQSSIKAHSDAITHIAIRPNGKQFVTSSYDNTIKLWSIEGQLLRTIQAHNGCVRAVAWHPGGDFLASAGADRTTKLFTFDGREIAILHTCHCSCPEIRVMHIGSDGTSSPQTSQQLAHRHSYSIKLAFISDGNMLIDASSCGKPRLWSLDLETLLRQGNSWLQKSHF